MIDYQSLCSLQGLDWGVGLAARTYAGHLERCRGCPALARPGCGRRGCHQTAFGPDQAIGGDEAMVVEPYIDFFM